MRPLNLLMNQKNNLNNFFPLKVAIYSVLGFFTTYILFGLDGWGVIELQTKMPLVRFQDGAKE